MDTDRGDDDSVGTLGENGWDLAIEFDEPQPTSFPDLPDVLTSWQGNGDFYWKGIANADESQLSSSGANYDSQRRSHSRKRQEISGISAHTRSGFPTTSA